MENPINITRDITSLPPEAQKQVIDFAFLKTRYRSAAGVSRPHRTRLADEPFIGMWRNRKDLRCAVKYDCPLLSLDQALLYAARQMNIRTLEVSG